MLRCLISLLLVSVCTLGLMINHAEAKRFGGGKNFGMSRSISSPSRGASAFASKPTSMASKSSKWLGPLAGLAIGGILASLFMGHGIGTGILSWLLVAGIALVAVSLIRQFMQRNQPATPMGYNNYAANSREYHSSPVPVTAFSEKRYPRGFDEPAFLRDVKSQFIRLQAAYDKADLNDLRAFTTPEVFAEVRLQIQERGNAVNQTDVVNLEAQLLDADDEVASVQFSGMIREDNQQAESFTETWHFRKEMNADRWIVAGIEQG